MKRTGIFFLASLREQSGRSALAGALRWAQSHPGAEILFNGHEQTDGLALSAGRRPAGVVGTEPQLSRFRAEHPGALDGVRAVVRINAPGPDGDDGDPGGPPVRRVSCDDAAIGRTAADFFAGKHLRSFAYVGVDMPWSRERGRAFAARLAEKGLPCAVYAAPAPGADLDSELSALARFLKAVPKPFGAFAAFDQRARHVLEACRRAGIAVPERAMVLGVDNEEWICDLAAPPLSSVQLDFEAGGFEAARMCAALVAGREVPRRTVIYGLRGIVERASTQDVHGAGRMVAAAQEFIRKNAAAGISAQDVARAAGCSLRLLEKHWRAVRGTTPAEELRAERLRLVCRLLRTTSTPIGQIGALCGFRDDRNLKVLFRHRFGCTMREWRRRLDS